MFKFLIPILLLVLACGSCKKSEQPIEEPTPKTFAGTYIGTTHWSVDYWSNSSQSHVDLGFYTDSVIVTTWEDSIRFVGIMRANSIFGVVDFVAMDTGLIYDVTIAASSHTHELCKYTLSDTCDSLKVSYLHYEANPGNASAHQEIAIFNGIRR